MNKVTAKPMHRPSGASPFPPPVFVRNRLHNRWASPRQVQMLESLWNSRLHASGRRPRLQRTQEDLLRHISETIGRTVASPRELSWREANRVLRRMLDEIRSNAVLSVADSASPRKQHSKKPSAKQSPDREERVALQAKKSTQRRKPRHA